MNPIINGRATRIGDWESLVNPPALGVGDRWGGASIPDLVESRFLENFEGRE